MLHPTKLVRCFVRSRILCQQSFRDLLQPAFRGFLNLPQMGEQLARMLYSMGLCSRRKVRRIRPYLFRGRCSVLSNLRSGIQ